MAGRQLGGSGTTTLVIDWRAAAVRRSVGALAWSILEEVGLAAAVDGDGALAAAVDARSLALYLGIGKDTAARGLSRLVDAGILRRAVNREPSGRFGRSRYVLAMPAGLSVVATPTGSDGSMSGRAGRGAVRTGRVKESARSRQLSLLGAGSSRDG